MKWRGGAVNFVSQNGYISDQGKFPLSASEMAYFQAVHISILPFGLISSRLSGFSKFLLL